MIAVVNNRYPAVLRACHAFILRVLYTMPTVEEATSKYTDICNGNVLNG